jgi:hypothetical protein
VLIVGSRVANSRTYAFGFYTSFDSKSMVEDAISLVNRQNYILLTFSYFSPLSGGENSNLGSFTLSAARGLDIHSRNATFKFLSCIAS